MSEAELAAVMGQLDATPDDELVTLGPEILTELRAAAAARRDAEGRAAGAVRAARSAGMSWGIIGAQLGIGRQGARQRYAAITD
jgi:hypothetical protein